MKSKINIKNNINHKNLSLEIDKMYSTSSLFKPNKTISNFIYSIDLINNNIKQEYKSSFIQKNNKIENLTKKQKKLFPISNSKTNIPFNIKDKQKNDSGIKIEKFKTKFIKEIKLNLENGNITNKNNFKNKLETINDYNTKKIMNKKIPMNKVNQFNYKFQDFNTTRTSYNNNPLSKYNSNYIRNKNDRKNKYQIKIIKSSYFKEKINNTIKTEINDSKIVNKTIYGKLKLNKKDDKNKLCGNKNVIKIKEISNFEEMNKNEIKLITKKKTFVPSQISFKSNNYFNFKTINNSQSNKKDESYPYLNEDRFNKKNKFISNKTKINIRNNSIFDNKFQYKYDNLEICKNVDIVKYNKINITNDKNKKLNIKNKINKNKTNIIPKKTLKNLEKLNLEEKKNKELNLLKLKLIKIKKEKNINNYIQKKNIKNNIEKNDIEEFLDIGTEHKNVINKIKQNNFDVNKPKENNMKYTLLKEFENEEDNLNINKSQIEKIVIGRIDSYKDIIETDELNKSFKLRSKSSFALHKKITEKLIKKEKLEKKNDKNMKSFSNNKTSFVSMHILEDNSSEIEDLYFDNDDYRMNEELLNIENEYEFKDMTNYENESKINKENNLLTFHVSKISFNKKNENKDKQYKTIENINNNSNNIISLKEINKDLKNLNNKKKNDNNKLLCKNKNLKTNKINNNNNNKNMNKFTKKNKNNNTNKNINEIIRNNKIDKKKIEIISNNNNIIINNFNKNVKDYLFSKTDNHNDDCKLIKSKINKIIKNK